MARRLRTCSNPVTAQAASLLASVPSQASFELASAVSTTARPRPVSMSASTGGATSGWRRQRGVGDDVCQRPGGRLGIGEPRHPDPGCVREPTASLRWRRSSPRSAWSTVAATEATASATSSALVTSGGVKMTMIGVDGVVGEDDLQRLGGTAQPSPRRCSRPGSSPPLPARGPIAAAPGSALTAPARRGRSPRRRPPRARLVRRRCRRCRRRLPFGSGWWVTTSATSKSSSRVSTRMTPAWRKRASTVASGVAMAAVCDEAPRDPAAGPSGLDGDDGLFAGDAAGDPGEVPRVAERLQVQAG